MINDLLQSFYIQIVWFGLVFIIKLLFFSYLQKFLISKLARCST